MLTLKRVVRKGSGREYMTWLGVRVGVGVGVRARARARARVCARFMRNPSSVNTTEGWYGGGRGGSDSLVRVRGRFRVGLGLG